MSHLSAAQASDPAAVVGIVLAIIIAIVLYWVPTIVGARRRVPNMGSVAVINGLLGWTFVGWVVALAMACRSRPGGSVPV